MSKVSRGRYDKETVKAAATGHWRAIHASCGVPEDSLDGKPHPCPVCGGTDRFNVGKDYQQTGTAFCRHCEIGGDGLKLLEKVLNIDFPEALRTVAEFLGLAPNSGAAERTDIIAEVCRAKRMPLDAFKQFGATPDKRNRRVVARVPVYNGRGEQHSSFDLTAKGKGWFAQGKGMSGMFFPGRQPEPGETWHLVEGVKDAAALVGLGFNAAGLPTNHLSDKYAELFRGVDVVLVPDLDESGQIGAQKSGGNLKNIAASVRVARLPGEIVKSAGHDVRDVLAREEGEQLVRDAIKAAEPWMPREGEPDPEDGRPEVLLTLNFNYHTDQVIGHLGQLGWKSPWIPTFKRESLKLYHRGGVLVHVVTESDETRLRGSVAVPNGAARIRTLPNGQLLPHILSACKLLKEVEESDGSIKEVTLSPPKWLVDSVATRGDYSEYVRRLEGIITSPTLRPDGSVLQRAGYDKQTGLLYKPSDAFPTVPQKPTVDDAKRAADQLLDIVADFEFVSDADRSGWLALVLSFIGRPAIAGCVPLFGVTATTRGSGKTLLVDAASMIAYGRPSARKPFSSDDDEMRKAITAIAMEALNAVMLDNVDKTLGGASLDAALTALTWSDRILGSNQTTGDLPLRTIWTATGNNLRFGSDLARRVLPIRLAPSCERPEERTGFQHPDLLGWTQANRPALAVAALTMLRAYFVAGKPEQSGGTWGSFDAWTALVRGSIVWAGFADPLETRDTAKAEDASGAIVRGLIGGLLEMDEHGDGLTGSQIIKQLEDPANAARFPTMREAVAEAAMSRGSISPKRLGCTFRKYRGRIANGWRLEGELNRTGVMRWRAESATAGDAGHAGDDLGHLIRGGHAATQGERDVCETRTGGKQQDLSPACPASPAHGVASPDVDWAGNQFDSQ